MYVFFVPAFRGGRLVEKDITTNSLIENNDVFADIANVNIFGGQMMIKQDDLESVPIDASYKDLKGKHH